MTGEEAAYLYLTTTGRSSGLARQIEIWFVGHEGCWYLISGSYGDSDWVKNIAAQPAVQVQIGQRSAPIIAAHGRAIDADTEPALAQAVRERMNAKYGWSSGLIVELCPASS